MKKYFKLSMIVWLAFMLSACAFHARQERDLPFKTIYTNINTNTEFGAELAMEIKAEAPNIQFNVDPGKADIQLIQLKNTRSTKEHSINASGQVLEYLLSLEYSYTIIAPNIGKKGSVLIPETRILQNEYYHYYEGQESVKSVDIDLTFKEMERKIILSIARRITSDEVIERYNTLKHRNALK